MKVNHQKHFDQKFRPKLINWVPE